MNNVNERVVRRIRREVETEEWIEPAEEGLGALEDEAIDRESDDEEEPEDRGSTTTGVGRKRCGC